MQEFIKHCQEQYAAGNPIMSNEEYDMIVKRFPDAETDIGVAGEVPHMFRMFSLDKKYPCRGDVLPTNLGDYVKTPKLDGCAVDLLYVNGKLQQCLTRGDGIKGKDRTANLSQLVESELGLFLENPIVQITGEVLVSKEVANMRNYSSGAVNLDDPAEFAQRIKEGGLIFVAYGLQITDKYIGCEDWYGIDMELLHECGFNTVTSSHVQEMAESGKIPTDGIVYRLRDNNKFNELGFTHKFPRASFAVKEDIPCTWTTIKEVVFQVGKSGKVTPVAIVEPITIDDASISRVTLNNIAYMEAMGITHIGQKVGLIRSGGVIPKVVEVEPYVE